MSTPYRILAENVLMLCSNYYYSITVLWYHALPDIPGNVPVSMKFLKIIEA